MNSDPKFAQSADVVADQAVLLLAGEGRGLAVEVEVQPSSPAAALARLPHDDP